MRAILYRWLSKLPNYLRGFGPVAGLRLLFQIERDLPIKSSHIRRFSVPGFPPILLRDSSSDHATFWQCIVRRQYNLAGYPQSGRLNESYQRILADGARPLIIDCGANIGLSALWFAREFPQARILAIEPDDANFDLLQKNVASLRGRIEPLQGGIWPRKESLAIQNPDSGSAAFSVLPAEAGARSAVTGYTMDELLAKDGSETAFIVKMDIEGAQQYLFEQAADWVGRCHLIILELDDWQFPWRGTSRNFFRCISRYPFEYLLGGENICCFRDFEAPLP